MNQTEQFFNNDIKGVSGGILVVDIIDNKNIILLKIALFLTMF